MQLVAARLGGCGHNPESECEGEGEEQQIVKNKQPYVATEGKWEEENSVYWSMLSIETELVWAQSGSQAS